MAVANVHAWRDTFSRASLTESGYLDTVPRHCHDHLEDRDVKRRTVAVALGGLLCASVAAPAAASVHGQADRPTGQVVIETVKVNGSGCRPGTASVAVSPDNTAFTVAYSGYLVQAGAATGKKDLQKDCKLTLKVGVPKGFTYTIESVDYRGFAHLEPGATGQANAGYFFQGAGQTVTMSHPFTAPMDDDWQATDTPAAVFEPCGKQRALNIDTELTVSAGTSDPKTTSYMSMDSTDGSLHTTYHLAWKTC
jgi:hypothetical protein